MWSELPDLRQVRAFVAVAETESFTRAAEKLFLTQSAVSHSLRGLEEQLMRVKAWGPVKGALKANSVDVRSEIPPMLDDTRARLIDRFAPEVEGLRTLLPGRALPWTAWD